MLAMNATRLDAATTSRTAPTPGAALLPVLLCFRCCSDKGSPARDERASDTREMSDAVQ
ncbi:hypothetical protein GCM10009675_34740 [Prauserella alba]|uniref:Uncharacterized protein n=1 Tax=Prauserella alba TaxID=176898 RepID=A0ABP4G2G5_9PSEU